MGLEKAQWAAFGRHLRSLSIYWGAPRLDTMKLFGYGQRTQSFLELDSVLSILYDIASDRSEFPETGSIT
jgi:hypothetical protein